MNPSSTSKPEEELEWDVIPELESWSIEDDFFEMSLEEKMEVDDVPGSKVGQQLSRKPILSLAK